ncbi:ABC transporter permease [Donghicola sp. C2-DW-16]|uniref:Transport permease protein n=1 Tax=Donghicola mangrovi TaxID=2729614 RepID=A0ABX2PF02_9RHOB|nr:ABC transporter permease [Donghicola mangrovi]NVO28077.1 ABC transporter permease [Donghicola mangrovi]
MTNTSTNAGDARRKPRVSANAPSLEARRPSGGTQRHFKALRTIVALMLREMSTRYGRTPGGYIWSLLEPVAAILFLSFGFSLMIRTPPLGTSFLLFYTTGYLPFGMYNNISNTTAKATIYSRSLLKFPAVNWLDAILARLFLNSLTNIVVMFIVIGGVWVAVDGRSVIDLPSALVGVGLAIILGLGVGTVNSVLMGLYPLWSLTWSIITRPLFLASGVLFLFRDLPPLARDILWYNPLIHITGIVRAAFYSSYDASYTSVTYVMLLSMTLLTLGLILMGRYHRDLLND